MRRRGPGCSRDSTGGRPSTIARFSGASMRCRPDGALHYDHPIATRRLACAGTGAPEGTAARVAHWTRAATTSTEVPAISTITPATASADLAALAAEAGLERI